MQGTKADVDIDRISQWLLYQQPDEIPDFFKTIQLLLVVNAEAKYATVGTPITHWLEWKDQLTEVSAGGCFWQRLPEKPLSVC